MPMMYEQFCVRPDAVKEKDPEKVRIDKDDMYTGMGIVRALPGPVFSIASFTGGMALKDYGKTAEERGIMQLLGCVIGTVAIFLPSALLVLFFFPIWRKVKRDYIGVKIVIEVFFINLQNGSVATEYIVYGAKPSLLLPKD